MWVASYGVMPQTYIRARPDAGPTGTTRCRPVSNAWTGRGTGGPAKGGRGRALQACMGVTLSGL